MKSTAIGTIVVAVVLLGGGTRVPTKPNHTNVFVGTIPCGEAIRAFVGGIAAGASCQSIILRLDLGVTERDGPGWNLTAAYGANMASNVGAMPDGGVSISGKLEKSGTMYR